MRWIKFTIETTTHATDLVIDMLGELGIEGVEIVDNVPLTDKEEKEMYIDIPAKLPADDGSAMLHFYLEGVNEQSDASFYSTGSSIRDAKFLQDGKEKDGMALCVSPDETADMVREALAELAVFGDIGKGTVTWTYTQDEDWMNNWKNFFKPFYVAEDILVKPVWEALPSEAKPTDIVLEIDPGTAFGTGSHETSKLCLLLLRKYIKKGTSILDAGCGSGILAIAALKLGAESARGLDIDPVAVAASMDNAKLNDIEERRFHVSQGNILEGDAKGHYDIVVANILAEVIVAMCPVVKDYLKPGALFISSGILAEKADEVADAIENAGMQILERQILGEWAAFVSTYR